MIVDADLSKADPARKSLEETIALRKPPQRIGRARREQPEIAGILRDLGVGPPIEEQIKALDQKPPRRRLVLPMRFGGVDHVEAVIEPMTDQPLDQRRRMLAVAIDEQRGAEPGMVEAGEQGRFLAEIARQRDDLNVDGAGGELMNDSECVVAASVVDIDH